MWSYCSGYIISSCCNTDKYDGIKTALSCCVRQWSALCRWSNVSGTVIQEFHVWVRLLCWSECTLGRSALTVIRFQKCENCLTNCDYAVTSFCYVRWGTWRSPRESMEMTDSMRLQGYLRQLKVERSLSHSALKPSVSGNIIVFHKLTG